MLNGAISCDVDTLASIYHGHDLRRTEGYSYDEFRMGLENLCRFLEPYNIRATFFMVGDDFKQPGNTSSIRAVHDAGHEIANHTMTHAQGFRLLSQEDKEAEIAGMEQICEEVTGERPVGFRSPGWNIGDDALPILRERGYIYDSSVFPSILNPLLKFLHWSSMSSRSHENRTTLGHLRYIVAPTRPYRVSEGSLGKRGETTFVELPVTVVPIIRLPFFATFHLATGFEFFKTSFAILKMFKFPIQYQVHLSDFVDYSHPSLSDQVPEGRGVYIPQALRTPLGQKIEFFRKIFDVLSEDYSFSTLRQWALNLV